MSKGVRPELGARRASPFGAVVDAVRGECLLQTDKMQPSVGAATVDQIMVVPNGGGVAAIALDLRGQGQANN